MIYIKYGIDYCSRSVACMIGAIYKIFISLLHIFV